MSVIHPTDIPIAAGPGIDMQTRGLHAARPPRQLYIEVTNKCNSLCKSCPLTYDHFLPWEPKHHLGWDEFRRIVDQVPVIERAVLHGIGEPLLNPELPRMVAHLKARGAHVLFNTNAVLLDETRGDALTDAGLDELRISLDALTPELYHKLRGIDKLPRILDNIRAFAARRAERRALEAKQPAVSLWFVGMQENLHELADIVRFAIGAGVPEVHLQRLVYFGDGATLDDEVTAIRGQSLHASLEQLQERMVRECETLARASGIKFSASGATTPGESLAVNGKSPWQGCYRPWSLMYITATGNALPCCIAPFAVADYEQIMLGNVLHNPLEEVWNGGQYQALRGAVLSDGPAPWPCQHCGVKWSL
jgi:MoaA/NifB/PqqE/SkfB family radical SAM enzyme